MDLEARRRHAQRRFFSMLEHVELEGGVLALLNPASAERSKLNGVLYDGDPGAVLRRLDELAALYDDAGVRAWTVWVHPPDRELAGALEDRDHVLDATPEAMGARLDELDLDGPDLGEPLPWDELIDLNERAYGLAPGEFGPMAAIPPDPFEIVGVPGRACVAVLDHDGNAAVEFVATHPEARGQGLAGALMRQALRAARERGCATTTLESTKLGRPVYERLGYRSLGTLQMWERRTG